MSCIHETISRAESGHCVVYSLTALLRGLEEMSFIGVPLTASPQANGFHITGRITHESHIPNVVVDFLALVTPDGIFPWKVEKANDKEFGLWLAPARTIGTSWGFYHARRLVLNCKTMTLDLPFSDFLCAYGQEDLLVQHRIQQPLSASQVVALAFTSPFGQRSADTVFTIETLECIRIEGETALTYPQHSRKQRLQLIHLVTKKSSIAMPLSSKKNSSTPCASPPWLDGFVLGNRVAKTNPRIGFWRTGLGLGGRLARRMGRIEWCARCASVSANMGSTPCQVGNTLCGCGRLALEKAGAGTALLRLEKWSPSASRRRWIAELGRHVMDSPRGPDGIWLTKPDRAEVWIDTLATACPFLARAGSAGFGDDWIEQAVEQLCAHAALLQ
jgi:hypothetical protein